MRFLLFLLSFSLGNVYHLTAQNLITNGGFENDLASWWTDAANGSEAAFAVITDDATEGNKALNIEVVTPGANPWDVQAVNDAWASETGEIYTLNFQAKATAAGGSFKVIMQSSSSYAEQIFTLTEAWETYEWTFSAQDDGLELKLHFPNAGNFYVDGFSIPDEGEQPTTEELVLNGGFEEGNGNSFNNWWLGAGSGSATFAESTDDVVAGERAFMVTIDALGANPWDIQAVNDAWPSVSGEEYTLSFQAKSATSGGSFKAVMQIGASYAEQVFTVTDTWEEYEWTFTAQADGLELKFQFLSTGTFYLDEVSIPGEAISDEYLPIIVEAESGTVAAPSDPPVFETLTEDDFTFVRVQQDFADTQFPGNADHVISYTVEFPRAGTYDLYARLRVGAGNFSDDSFYYGNGLGEKAVDNGDDWITVNGLAAGGHTDPDEIVTGGGSEANEVWKWLKLSDYAGQGEAPIQIVVPEGSLSQTFQIGSRENGLDFDKFAFGADSVFFTVENLDNGEAGSTVPPPPPFTPTGPPIAQGQDKFLGNVYSNAQRPFFENYWNQVTPENAGKWGSVEGTRDVMNWTQLDSAYALAKNNGFLFRFHVLIWGSQQPGWIDELTPAEQLEEIEEWMSLVAERYPDIDFIEVVNEPLHQPPSYIEALGGSGETGWDWILNSFRLAKQYFPNTPLIMNDYSIFNDGNATTTYLEIIELLQAEDLIDIIGEQGHAFSTRGPVSTLVENLDRLAATGLPIQITEFDIDGPTDEVQLQDYQRIFPPLWEHPAVMGITLWGWKPGHWRTAQGAYIALENGYERPALVWLRAYVSNSAPEASFTATPTEGFAPLEVAFDASSSTDANEGDILTYSWDFGDGTTATGVTAEHTYTTVGEYTATLIVTDSLNDADTTSTLISVASPLKVQYKVLKGKWLAEDLFIWPFLRIVNEGTTAVPYDELVVRYWYTRESDPLFRSWDKEGQYFRVDYADIGRKNVNGSFVELTDPVEGADHYLEISFTSSAMLAPDTHSGTILTRSYNANLGRYNEWDDYSYGASNEDFTDWEKITLYRKQEDGSLQLLWGTEPAGAPAARTETLATKEAPEATTSEGVDRWNVYPNPTPGGNFTIEGNGLAPGESAQIQLIDFEGKEVFSQKIYQRLNVDNQKLEPGLYILRIISEDGVAVKKLKVE
uniref:endo-1,4-beta-xylanase n=1 Tax=Roseihalotalea indica TaxID=2867963 RepID=A0AA49JIA6_9BACT|nr:endo-1,4-beta-xylanase [Tunicatimonas sp. TK19036]